MLVFLNEGLDFSELSIELAVFVDENLLFAIAFPFLLEGGDFGDKLAVGGGEAVANFLQFVDFEFEDHFFLGLELVI